VQWGFVNSIHIPRNEHSKTEFGKKNSVESLENRRLFPGVNPATSVRCTHCSNFSNGISAFLSNIRALSFELCWVMRYKHDLPTQRVPRNWDEIFFWDSFTAMLFGLRVLESCYCLPLIIFFLSFNFTSPSCTLLLRCVSPEISIHF